jgi:hypothetical protein
VARVISRKAGDYFFLFNYASEMGSGAVIYVPSFIKIGSGIQKLMGGADTDTHTDSNVIS